MQIFMIFLSVELGHIRREKRFTMFQNCLLEEYFNLKKTEWEEAGKKYTAACTFFIFTKYC